MLSCVAVTGGDGLALGESSPGEVTVPTAAGLTVGCWGGDWTGLACLPGRLLEGGSGVNNSTSIVNVSSHCPPCSPVSSFRPPWLLDGDLRVVHHSSVFPRQ